jgi:glycosyltransferase involved in cell wall biosynthesis
LQGKLVLGFIGSFYAYEGLTLLIRALPDIIRQKPDIRLLLVGGGPQDTKLKAMVGQLQLQEAVLFTGRVPHGEVSNYYNLVDIFAYPRLNMRLTDLVTPLKPLEAMAQGKLVVASDVGGHKELITDGENGRLFRAGNSQSLTETIVNLINEKDRWEQMKITGRKYVEQERNWPLSVSRYVEVYKGLVAGR